MISNIFSYNYLSLQSKCIAICGIAWLLHFTPIVGYSPFYNFTTKIAVIISIIIFLYGLKYDKLIIISKNKVLILTIAFVFVFFFIAKLDFVLFLRHITILWPIFIIIGSSEKLSAKSFNYFKIFFIISIIPSILLYPFIASGLQPAGIITPNHEYKEAAHNFYYNFLFSFQYIDIYSQKGLGLYRMSGLFDEPGVIGTFSAFFLVIDRFKFNKNNLILFISGILSFSFAFYVLTLVYMILNIKSKSIMKFLLLTIIFLSLFQSNTFVKERLFDRFTINDGRLSGDNRTTEHFEHLFSNFVSTSDIWMGSNKSSYQLGEAVCSWKNLFFEYGIIGTTLLLLFFIIYTVNAYENPNKYFLHFVIIFTLSIYQRPHIFDTSYILLFVGGLAHIRCVNLKRISNGIEF